MRLSLLKNRLGVLQFMDSGVQIPKYTVTWLNWDGTVLEVDENVLEGGMPAYNGATPTKPSTSTHRYDFTGWTPTVERVTGDATYTATFQEVQTAFTVRWVNYNGTVLETDTNVPLGATPSYNGSMPVRDADWAFNGWTPTPAAVTQDITYTATYRSLTSAVAAFLKRTITSYESV